MNREGQEMGRNLRAVAAAGTLLITIAGAGPTLAQRSGGVLKIYHRDSPASMSILEEATNSTEIPMMGVCKRRSKNPSLKRPDSPVAPE